MNGSRIVPFLVLCSVFASPELAFSQVVNGGNCSTFIQKLFAEGRDFYGLNANVARVSARNGAGSHSFSMSDRYQVESGLANPAAGTSSIFPLTMDGWGYQYAGKFNMVFPGRGNGDEDLTTLSITRNGTVNFVLNKWGNNRITLSDLRCYSGHGNNAKEFIITGYHRTASHGVEVFSILIVPKLFS